MHRRLDRLLRILLNVPRAGEPREPQPLTPRWRDRAQIGEGNAGLLSFARQQPVELRAAAPSWDELERISRELDARLGRPLDERDRIAVQTALAKAFATGGRLTAAENALAVRESGVPASATEVPEDPDVWTERYG